MKRLLLSSLIFTLFLPVKVIADQQPSIDDIPIQISDDLIPLLDLLKEKGFNIKFEIPPRKGVYGLFQSKNKTIWISPISFELGIGRQTILHEATHAAQSCPDGLLTPIGWKLSTSQCQLMSLFLILCSREHPNSAPTLGLTTRHSALTSSFGAIN